MRISRRNPAESGEGIRRVLARPRGIRGIPGGIRPPKAYVGHWSQGILLVSCIETKAELVEQKDRGCLPVLDLAGLILGIIPGLLVLFLVSVDPYRAHVPIRNLRFLKLLTKFPRSFLVFKKLRATFALRFPFV